MTDWQREREELKTHYEQLRVQASALQKEIDATLNLLNSDLESSLVRARRALEVIVIELCERELHRERGTEPLASLLTRLKDVVPESVLAAMDYLNKLGNLGAHPKAVRDKDVRQALVALAGVLDWYVVDYKKSFGGLPIDLADDPVALGDPIQNRGPTGGSPPRSAPPAGPDRPVAEGPVSASLRGPQPPPKEETIYLVLDETVGIETLGGVLTPLFAKGTALPASTSLVFSTAEDNQKGVTVHVVAGNTESVADGRSLGRFDVNDLPPAPKAIPQVEITFLIIANGRLGVTAVTKPNGVKESFELGEARIQRIRREGGNLFMNAAIDAGTARQGGELKLSVLGREVTMKVPPGTHSHKTFRLRRLGIKPVREGIVGDLYCTVLVAGEAATPT